VRLDYSIYREKKKYIQKKIQEIGEKLKISREAKPRKTRDGNCVGNRYEVCGKSLKIGQGRIPYGQIGAGQGNYRN
jgi:hypothetical protein